MTGRGRAVLVAGGLLLALSVALPAAVASYRHGITVVARSGDVAMSRWLPWSTDGLLIAALVTVWVRRLTGRAVGAGPWAAYAAGMVAVVATNVAAAQLTVEGVLVAVWPPVVVAIVLELVALQLAPDRPAPAGDEAGEGWESDADGPPDWWATAPDSAPSTVAEYAALRGLPGPRPPASPARPGALPPAGGAVGEAAPAPGDDRAAERESTGHGRADTGEPVGEVDEGRLAELIAEGAGRRKVARELDVTEHVARQLLARGREGAGERVSAGVEAEQLGGPPATG